MPTRAAQRLLFVVLVFLSLPSVYARAAGAATEDDTARFLAGMSVLETSPLAPLAETPAWKQHAAYFDATFKRVEDRQFSKIETWSKANLNVRRDTLFYFFSGPDFLYANAFFPDAKTYVLAGLESPGELPDLTKLPKGSIPYVLRAVQNSTRTILNVSFFRTIEMQSDLRTVSVRGTVPVLAVFMVRSGKVIKDVALIHLDENGDVQPGSDAKGKVPGAKITFSSPGGPEQTLYYFGANIADGGFKRGGLEAFCDKLGEGDALVKSASYLLHGNLFAEVRSFLLAHSAAILQDDTGIPVALYDPKKWDLHPFGRYVGPIPMFRGYYQPRMTDVFRKNGPTPIDFGVGYRYRPNESSLLFAVKQESAPKAADKPDKPESGAKAAK